MHIQKKVFRSFILPSAQTRPFVKSKPFLQWETDLKATFTECQWTSALQHIYKSTSCSTLWYLTPAKLVTFYKQASHICWRDCGHAGDILHILWECPVLQTYWQQIFRIISMVTHTRISPSPELALLNLTVETFAPSVRNSVTHILLAARLNITRHWKKTQLPSAVYTLDLIHKHCSYEIMLGNLGCSGTILPINYFHHDSTSDHIGTKFIQTLEALSVKMTQRRFTLWA